MQLKPIGYKKEYERVIANKIIIWLWANVYKECFAIMRSNTVENASDKLLNAIRTGLIYYRDGAFYSSRTRFSNEIAKELETLGAKYSKYRKAYVMANPPIEILWAIDTAKAVTAQKVATIQAFLTYQLGRLGDLEKKLIFDEAVNQIMLDLQKRVYANAKKQKIELITPKLTEFRQNEIAKRYTENLDFWIKNWTSENIIKMREVVGQMSIEGKSRKDIENYIVKEFGIAQRHAKFLARNESAIATTSYLQAKYKDEGFTNFKWVTNLDGRERPLHKELNGKIFSFDNPPIIDERTGQRGLPAETYNCRCLMSPVINKEFLENRKALFKAQNSIFEKIKDFINAKK